MKTLDKLVLWYLKKTNKCFIAHGKYGWKVAITFHSESIVKIEEYTLEFATRDEY